MDIFSNAFWSSCKFLGALLRHRAPLCRSFFPVVISAINRRIQELKSDEILLAEETSKTLQQFSSSAEPAALKRYSGAIIAEVLSPAVFSQRMYVSCCVWFPTTGRKNEKKNPSSQALLGPESYSLSVFCVPAKTKKPESVGSIGSEMRCFQGSSP